MKKRGKKTRYQIRRGWEGLRGQNKKRETHSIYTIEIIRTRIQYHGITFSHPNNNQAAKGSLEILE